MECLRSRQIPRCYRCKHVHVHEAYYTELVLVEVWVECGLRSVVSGKRSCLASLVMLRLAMKSI